MPNFYKRGEAFRYNPRAARPGSKHSEGINGHLQRMLEALPPPRPVIRLKDMSPEKQEEMRRLYERKP